MPTSETTRRAHFTCSDPTGRTTFGYDLLGRMNVRSNPGGENLYYEYDATSNRLLFQEPSGMAVYYRYDAFNRMAEVDVAYGTQPYGETPYGGPVCYYEYDLADELVNERRANATLTYHVYDAAGRLAAIYHTKSDQSQIENYVYTRDEVGNPIQIDRGSDGYTMYFTYDRANRITKEFWVDGTSVFPPIVIYSFTYQYDQASNRNRKTNAAGVHTYWNYDLADQLVIQKNNADTRVYFEFDANGNLSVEHDVDASAGRTYYDYEPRNLLTRVDFPGAIATNYFAFNAAGERVRKDDSTGQKKYTWDGLDVVTERSLAGSVTQRLIKGYTPVGGIGAYAMQQVGSTCVWSHKNQVGTTVRMTDGSQTVVNSYEYDAWGQPLLTTEGTSQQYRFNQKELDPDFVDFNSANRRNHYPRRTYTPFRGGFVQADPLRLRTHPNGVPVHRLLAYAYVEARPLTHVDPLGLELCLFTNQDGMQADLINRFLTILRRCADVSTPSLFATDLCWCGCAPGLRIHFNAANRRDVFSQWLNRVVNGDRKVCLRLTDGHGALFDEFSSNTIDVGAFEDNDRLRSEAEDPRAIPDSCQWLTHILTEYWNGTTGSGFNTRSAGTAAVAHVAGIRAENLLTDERGYPGHREEPANPFNPDPAPPVGVPAGVVLTPGSEGYVYDGHYVIYVQENGRITRIIVVPR